MLFKKAEMMNKRASQPKFKMNEIIEVLPIEKGETVADIGSGVIIFIQPGI
jgi:cyclopropane fatty-acyl-phospholipid synthase-like methyltransferase